MRLRTQLGLFFLLMAGSVLSVGVLSLWGGARIVDRFSASLADVELLSRLRGLQNALSRQKSSADLVRRSPDAQEWDRLNALHRIAALQFKELSSFDWARGGQGAAVIVSAHAEVAPLLASHRRDAAEAASRRLEAVSFQVDAAEDGLSRDVRENQASLRRLLRLVGWLLFGFIFWQIVLAFFFAWNTFRSMHRALHVLQEGAQAFGEGRLDHHIPVSPGDELGDLAASFNRMAENIKNLESKTVHMHRMSAVGQLAGGVAHEINNPLTGVLGQAQLLLEKLPPEDPRRSHAEKIERAAVRCRRIVRSLLDFSRKKETHLEPYDLHEAVEATLELCGPDFQSRRVVVVREFAPGVPALTGNASQLQQVFLNIISNAMHVMPDGGTLTITTVFASFPDPRGGGRVEGVEASFRDTGGGISPEHLEHVFEPFFTTKEIGKGTGLGLSVSLGIVRNHGGDIRVESAGKGKGAVFRVLLPLAPPSAPRPARDAGVRFAP